MGTRPPERDESDAVLSLLLPFAQDMLRKRGEFIPFGGVMRTDGEVELVAGYTGSEQPPLSQEVIDLLVEGLWSRAATGAIKAAGICYDVRVRTEDGKTTDAISVSLEHRAWHPVSILMPYSKGRFTGLRFGEMTASPGERRIFAEP